MSPAHSSFKLPVAATERNPQHRSHADMCANSSQACLAHSSPHITTHICNPSSGESPMAWCSSASFPVRGRPLCAECKAAGVQWCLHSLSAAHLEEPPTAAPAWGQPSNPHNSRRGPSGHPPSHSSAPVSAAPSHAQPSTVISGTCSPDPRRLMCPVLLQPAIWPRLSLRKVAPFAAALCAEEQPSRVTHTVHIRVLPSNAW